MREWVCVNGVLSPADEAKVSAFDSGFLQGIGLFETMRAEHGQIFRLDQHLDRLVTSARTLGWQTVPDVERIRDDIDRVVGATESNDVRVRLTVTTGQVRATERDRPDLTVVVSGASGASYPQELYEKGVGVMLAPYRQHRDDPTTGHKTTSYFARLTALRAAHAQGLFEALWITPEGELAEGSISSVFIVQDAVLVTPGLDYPILPGITRAAVIELAAVHNMPLREVPIGWDEVMEADEIFLTNAMMDVMPVVRVDRHAVGNEKPGPITVEVMQRFASLVQRECGDE